MTRDDLNGLLNAVIPFARELMDKHAGFYPFGASLTSDGQTELIGAAGGSERPPSQEVIDILLTGLRDAAKDGRIRASAVCADVKVKLPGVGKTDAIRVTLEDRGGEALNAFLPYKVHSGDAVEYGEMTFARADPLVFQPPPKL